MLSTQQWSKHTKLLPSHTALCLHHQSKISRGQSSRLHCFLFCLRCLSHSWHSTSVQWMINGWMAYIPPLPPSAPMAGIANWSQTLSPWAGQTGMQCICLNACKEPWLAVLEMKKGGAKCRKSLALRALIELSPLTSSPLKAPLSHEVRNISTTAAKL